VATTPADDEKILFIGTSGYAFRLWKDFIAWVIVAIQANAYPEDEEVTISSSYAGRNYYDMPSLLGKRFRLYRDGILLNKTQWQPSATGGWELLQQGDQFAENQVFTIQFY
jgi:hypothetical protein